MFSVCIYVIINILEIGHIDSSCAMHMKLINFKLQSSKQNISNLYSCQLVPMSKEKCIKCDKHTINSNNSLE